MCAYFARERMVMHARSGKCVSNVRFYIIHSFTSHTVGKLASLTSPARGYGHLRDRNAPQARVGQLSVLLDSMREGNTQDSSRGCGREHADHAVRRARTLTDLVCMRVREMHGGTKFRADMCRRARARVCACVC